MQVPGVPGPGDDRSSGGASSDPAAAQVPASLAGEMSAPCRDSPAISEFRLRPATYRSVNSSAMNPFVTRPLPIAFGGPGAVTVAGARHRRARRYWRRQCATRRTVTSQSSCSITWPPSNVNGTPHSGQQYPPPGKPQITSTLGR